jgi:hypothetical protein
MEVTSDDEDEVIVEEVIIDEVIIDCDGATYHEMGIATI